MTIAERVQNVLDLGFEIIELKLCHGQDLLCLGGSVALSQTWSRETEVRFLSR
jgi:hypothetical protein